VRCSHFENGFITNLSGGSSDFNESWCATADFGSKDGHVTKYQNFAYSKWRTTAMFKIFFWKYMNDLLSD